MTKFKAKQLWELDDGVGRHKYVFVIGLCKFSGDEYIHIAILDEHRNISIGHLPISVDALEKSNLTLIDEISEIDIPADGLNYWEVEYQKKAAGYYSAPILEVVG